MTPKDSKCLAEVDFPIAEASPHAARERSTRHGHPSTLHLSWARRPLASSWASLLCVDERRVAEDPRDCHWLYVVTSYAATPTLETPIPDPASRDWNENTKVAHYYPSVNAMAKPMQVRQDTPPFGADS